MPRIHWIEVRGFRSFGSDPQRLSFESDLALVWGPNSQGKTSLAEAAEFLFTGETSRREFLASAKREFADSLRNAHLAAGDVVSVRASIDDDAGTPHTIERVLTADYRPREDCTSTLTIDGAEAPDLTSLGIHLSQPPLRAPVLMQHCLRYVLSAGPQARSDYFKAVLEVAGLERVRSAVDRGADALGTEEPETFGHLATCLTDATLRPSLSALQAETRPTQELVDEALNAALGSALSGVDPLPDNLASRRTLVNERVQAARAAAFPVDGFQTGAAIVVSELTEEAVWAPLREFAGFAAETDQEVARLTDLFTAVLAVPAVADATEPIDCPVCTTPRALTPERIATIRRELEATRRFRDARSRAVTALRAVGGFATSIRRQSDTACPDFFGWTVEERTRRGFTDAAIAELLGDRADELVPPWTERRAELTAVYEQATSQATALQEAVAALQTENIRTADVTSLQEQATTLAESAQAVQTELGNYLPAQRRIVDPINADIDARRNLAAQQALIDLVDARTTFYDDLVAARARANVRALVETALEEIDAAGAAVFDARFTELGDEIGRWWRLLRADEATYFDGVRRAGTGRRYVDLKAGLSERADGSQPGAIRDAVAVFSDSQLNCLGLAAFLARIVRENGGFVILDDPVPASDTDYQTPFVANVLDELLGLPCQVIVLTHDHRFSESIQTRHQHRTPDVYQVTLEDPRDGSMVQRTTDYIDQMLARAHPFTGRHDPESRKTAARHLRDGTERFCKILLIRDEHARGNTAASLDDYTGNDGTLAALEPQVIPLLTQDPSHPGKLTSLRRHLNPGGHDDTPPESSALRVCYGDLKRFKSDYLS